MGAFNKLIRVLAQRQGLAAVSVVLVLAAGCASAAAPAAALVYLALGDYFISPSPNSVAASQVEFVAKNVGAMEHEVVVLKTDRAPDALMTSKSMVIRVAMTSGGRVNEEAAGQLVGKIEGVKVGETKTGTFQLTPGKYVLFCNLHGHYLQGMTTGFHVK